jgi:hypothetical protein
MRMQAYKNKEGRFTKNPAYKTFDEIERWYKSHAYCNETRFQSCPTSGDSKK